MNQSYDALLLVSFGGPEKRDDVLPFLENVLRGENVPAHRVQEVAEHYYLFDGVSPINAQNRSLLVSLVAELNRHGRIAGLLGQPQLAPLLPDVFGQMADDGVRRAGLRHLGLRLLFRLPAVPGGHPRARGRSAPGPGGRQAPLVLQSPGVHRGRGRSPVGGAGQGSRRSSRHPPLIYTAHSIPEAMARVSPYAGQLREACGLVSQRGRPPQWELVYQSRSGPPSQPWLGPDLYEHLRAPGARRPCGAGRGAGPDRLPCGHGGGLRSGRGGGQLCDELGLTMVRAGPVANHPRFVAMIRQLILERTEPHPVRLALGSQGPSPDVCPEGCCTHHRY